ncbi:MAG TPA: metallophosphoesterase [Melioribacteraceae bacterium]|nr:metallophosphoesterase [Melioribacteraceae bacterium]
MKLQQAIIFFGIVFSVYGIVNYYIFRRVVSIVPDQYKTIFTIIFVFVVLSYIVGRFLENYWVWYVSDFLVWVGSFWIAIMFYSLLMLIIIDAVRIINYFLPIIPNAVTANPDKLKQTLALIVSVLVLIIVTGGFFNSRLVAIKKYAINLDKKAGDLKSLNIVMASDLHLGTVNGKNFAYRIVDKINKQNPDIILLAGDIIDEDIKPVLRDNVGEALLELKAKYGVFGITGNHEYIGGVKDAVDYLTNHNIRMLIDSYIKIDSSLYIVGRADRDSRRFADYTRKPLEEILVGADKSLPLILMDHQPFQLNDARNNGIDLQLSGHTHNGQLWPINYIVEKIYEIAWGYRLIEGTHYYVSSGVGTWGPPIRTGSRPEIIKLTLNFN